MCRSQSIADLSRVVSFFALVGPGSGASAVFGFRGPGLLMGGLGTHDEPDTCDVEVVEACAMGFEGDESAEIVFVSAGVGVVWACSVKGGIDSDAFVETPVVSSSCKVGSFHKGHFVASGEPSGTSITSLQVGCRHQRKEKEWRTGRTLHPRQRIYTSALS